MFGIDSAEVLIIAIVALVVIGPRDLPRVMRTIGNFVGRARGMARHFRSGIDAMMRESELEEMEKKWKADNERIMREHPPTPAAAQAGDSDWGKPVPEAAAPVTPQASPDLPEAPAKPRPVPAARALSGTAPPIPPSGITPPAPGERP